LAPGRISNAAPLASALQFTPFANISVPSSAMVGYARFYLIVILAVASITFSIAICKIERPVYALHKNQRDELYRQYGS
jgi:hypothetical protein